MLLQISEPCQSLSHDSVEKPIVLGIDLGTTNSVVAFIEEGKPQVLELDGKSSLTPSIVSYDAHLPIVGRKASSKKHHVSSVKRLMGKGSKDPIAKHFSQVVGHESSVIKLQVNNNIVTPIEVSADILRYLKNQAEALLSKPVEKVVITVPAHFDEAARVATKDAAGIAGLTVLRLINEPTAAALAYGLETGAKGIYAIYDLGGGTFDLSLLNLEQGVFQVLATGGDLNIGGDDIDHAILESLIGSKAVQLSEQEHSKNLKDIREAKENLSNAETINLALQMNGKKKEYVFSRKHLEEIASPIVEKTIEIATELMNRTQVKLKEIQGVVLVGGMTRMPLVQTLVRNFFGQMPLCDMNPDHIVAIGAAFQSHALTQGSGTLLLDVTPLSLGLETMGGIVEKLIPRNTPIPTMASQEFTTYQDGQTAMSIHLVQGEKDLAIDCRSLAKFELKEIPPQAAGKARVKIDFIVDSNGMMTVSATEITTGKSQRIEVKPSYGLSTKALEKLLLNVEKR